MLDITGPPLLDRHRALKVRKQMWRSGQLERMLILLDLRETLNLPALCKNVLRRRPNLLTVTVIHPSNIWWRHRLLKMKRGNSSCQLSWISVVQYGCVFTYSRCLQCKLCHFLPNCSSSQREITEEKINSPNYHFGGLLSLWTCFMSRVGQIIWEYICISNLTFGFQEKNKTLSLLVLVKCFL